MLWKSSQLVNNIGRDRTDLRRRHRPWVDHSARESGKPSGLDPSVITNHMVRDPEQPRQRRIALRHIPRPAAEGSNEHLGRNVLAHLGAQPPGDIPRLRPPMAPIKLRERIGITNRLP
jgi:hypothetical protein